MKNCPKCESGEHTYNQWLLYNQEIKDFFRWKELGALIVMFLFFWEMLGIWIGTIATIILFGLSHRMSGGAVGDCFDEIPERKLKIKYTHCIICKKDDCKYKGVIQ